MKILEIKKIVEVNYYIEVLEDNPTHYLNFRRSEGGNWERLMGESWEPCYSLEDELELQFQRDWFR